MAEAVSNSAALSGRYTLCEIEERYGFPVASIVSMAEVVEVLSSPERPGGPVIDEALKGALDAYYAQYGVKA